MKLDIDYVRTVIFEKDNSLFSKLSRDSLSNYDDYSNVHFKKEADRSTFPFEVIAEDSMLLDFYFKKLTCICYLPEKIDREILENFTVWPELKRFKYLVVTPNIQNLKFGNHEAAEILNYDNFMKMMEALIARNEKLEKKEKIKEKKL
ncbi:MAG: hypothetical protein PHQ64_02665, partial [Bacilli bacterium]|nr:hypothetical protein [Bacilli bacterium]